jgi:hypothetical protein
MRSASSAFGEVNKLRAEKKELLAAITRLETTIYARDETIATQDDELKMAYDDINHYMDLLDGLVEAAEDILRGDEHDALRDALAVAREANRE